MIRPFAQVDVFTSAGARSDDVTGNAVAVVLDAHDMSDTQMAAFARWTNLSETTFVLPAEDSAADYRLRIFTPTEELPFAGHPTLGSAHAWLAAGASPRGERIVQECGVGLVSIKHDGDRLAFAAPPLLRSGPAEPEVVGAAARALGVDPDGVVASNWTDNGPGWLTIELASAEQVLALQPDFAAFGGLNVGVFGRYGGAGRPADIEVRAFAPGSGVPEDPVTGSLNAGVAVWQRSIDGLPTEYVASQGTAIGRAGRVYVHDTGDHIWVGGASTTVIDGTVRL